MECFDCLLLRQHIGPEGVSDYKALLLYINGSEQKRQRVERVEDISEKVCESSPEMRK